MNFISVLSIVLILAMPPVKGRIPIATLHTGNNEVPSCKTTSLPADVQSHLSHHFNSWTLKQPSDLSSNARGRWLAEKPLQCPGLATVKFQNADLTSYAVLLVPESSSKKSFKVVVFTRKPNDGTYDFEVVESGDSGADDIFIHSTHLNSFFDGRSRKRFHAYSSEGLLIFDAGEKEYEVDIYFWSDGTYKHQPLDH